MDYAKPIRQCFLSPLDQKRKKAIEWMGKKYCLHPANSPKRVTPAPQFMLIELRRN